MQRKTLAAPFILLALTIGGLAFFVTQDKDSTKGDVKSAASMETVTSERIGMTVQKDISLEQQSVSGDDEAKGRLWTFTSPASSQQEFMIDANYEQGASLKKLTGYTKQSLRDSVVTNVNLQLPKQYSEYKELTQRNVTINGIEANETVFEYDSEGVKVKQRLVLFFKNSDAAVYIRAQAKADEYDEVNSNYFEPIFSSVKFE